MKATKEQRFNLFNQINNHMSDEPVEEVNEAIREYQNITNRYLKSINVDQDKYFDLITRIEHNLGNNSKEDIALFNKISIIDPVRPYELLKQKTPKDEIESKIASMNRSIALLNTPKFEQYEHVITKDEKQKRLEDYLEELQSKGIKPITKTLKTGKSKSIRSAFTTKTRSKTLKQHEELDLTEF